MRVLHVVPSLSPRRGGPSSVMASLAPAQAALGLDVHVVASSAGLDADGVRAASARLAPARVTIVPMVGSERFELAPALLPVLAREVAHANLVHLHTVFTFPLGAAALIARLQHRPYVLRPAGTLDEVCLRERSYPLKRLALATWVGAMLKGAAAVHSTSALESAGLSRWVEAARLRELELGGDAIEVEEDRGARGTRLLTLGRLHPIKGLERLIDALPGLAPDVSLIIAGDGDAAYVAGLRAQVRARGLDTRVGFVGHVDEARRRRLLEHADLCVFPSRHESFGVAIVEAMSAGRAVVLSDEVGIAPTIAAAHAGRVCTGQPAALTEAIAGLLEDGTARRRLAQAGQALARARYSWRAAAERTRALYEELLR